MYLFQDWLLLVESLVLLFDLVLPALEIRQIALEVSCIVPQLNLHQACLTRVHHGSYIYLSNTLTQYSLTTISHYNPYALIKTLRFLDLLKEKNELPRMRNITSVDIYISSRPRT